MRKSEKWYIDRYVRAVSACLPCSGVQKKQIKKALRQRLEEYYADHADDIAAIEETFGAPDVIAAAYVDDMDTAELLRALRYRRRLVTTLVSGVLAALVLFAAALCVQLYDYRQAINGWDVVTIIED